MNAEQPPAPPPKPPAKPSENARKRSTRVSLNDREQAFVDAYRGNKTQAAIEAGYSTKTAGTIGARLYKKVHVQAEIRRQQLERQNAALMDRTEMQKLFSSTARDTKLSIRERLKAAELLGKSRGDFSTRLEVKGSLELHDLVRESIEKPVE